MWDERYAGKEFFYGTESNDFLRENIYVIKSGERILCLAEGEGRNAVFVAQSVQNAQVTALDSSRVGLNKALQLAQEKQVSITTVHADLAEFDLGTSQWDVVISIWCHLPSALRKKVHAGVVRALKPGGRFILEAYTPAQLKYNTGGPKAVDMLMSLAELRQELAGLNLSVGRECEREVQEGQGHTGHSAVVQIIGER